MKTCIKCKVDKVTGEFYKDYTGKTKDGIDYYCKYCRNGASIKSHNGKEKKCSLDDCGRAHYAKSYCRPHYARLVRHGSVESLNSLMGDQYKRDQQLRRNYVMTLETFNKMAINGCQICGDKPERSLHVDHDHTCCNSDITCGNCVRGVICNACNKAVEKYDTGVLRADNPKMEAIKNYVEAYNGKKR